MNSCIKCGRNNVAGPFYEQWWMGTEKLRYRCLTCGYQWTTHTMDNKKKTED